MPNRAVNEPVLSGLILIWHAADAAVGLAGVQFKALDQTVQTFNPVTNEKEAINYRCADMDRLIPQLMGVSKAPLTPCTARPLGTSSPAS